MPACGEDGRASGQFAWLLIGMGRSSRDLQEAIAHAGAVIASAQGRLNNSFLALENAWVDCAIDKERVEQSRLLLERLT